MHLARIEGSLAQRLVLDVAAHAVDITCVWLLAVSGISVEHFLYYYKLII